MKRITTNGYGIKWQNHAVISQKFISPQSKLSIKSKSFITKVEQFTILSKYMKQKVKSMHSFSSQSIHLLKNIWYNFKKAIDILLLKIINHVYLRCCLFIFYSKYKVILTLKPHAFSSLLLRVLLWKWTPPYTPVTNTQTW